MRFSSFVLWHGALAVPTIPNPFFAESTELVMIDALAATTEACARTKDFKPVEGGKGRQDVENIVLRFTENLDWFEQTILLSKDKTKMNNKVREEVQSIGMGLIGAILLIVFLVSFLLCCWQWWCCCSICRCCGVGKANGRRTTCFTLFMITVILSLLVSLAIGFAGYRQLVRSIDGTLCAGLEVIGLTFSTTKVMTGHMSLMLAQFNSFGTNFGVGKQIQDIMDGTIEIDIASSQLVSVLDAYEGALSKYDEALDNKFSCDACPLISSATAQFRDAYSQTSAGALSTAREMVKDKIQGSAGSMGSSLDASATSMGSLVEKMESLEVIIDAAKERDIFVQVLGAGVGAVFALALLVMLIILLSFACCCRNKDEKRIVAHHRVVRRCSSCGCWLAFFLSLLVLLLATVFEILLFSMSGVCIFLEDLSGPKLVNIMATIASDGSGTPPNATEIATAMKMATIYDTCFTPEGDGLLFDSMKMAMCPANLTNCTDSEKVDRSLREIFVDDTIALVVSAFSQVSTGPLVPLENSTVIGILTDTTVDDIRQNTTANSNFWADPRFAMVLAFQDTAPTVDNPNFAGLATGAIKLTIACDVPHVEKGKIFKKLPWFLGQINAMSSKKMSADVVTDRFASVPLACAESSSTLGPVTCSLFTTFSTQDDRYLAKSLAATCETKAAAAQASITSYSVFQQNINLVKSLDPTSAATAAETTAIQQLFGQASAAGAMQCNPCKAGGAVLDEIKRIWGTVLPADKLYNCPRWNLTSGLPCDVKTGASCTRTAAPWYSLEDNSCNMNNLAQYLKDFSPRITKSAQRIDTTTAIFGSTISSDLFTVVNLAFLQPLMMMAGGANCKPFGLKVTQMRETLCYDALIGLHKVDIAYVFLGICCILMVLAGWMMWLFGVKQGLNRANDVTERE